ncbi:MAG: DUF2167 domain-containing protein [Flavobacterium sp.]|uniref:DUF2167 domain-containing protein n=1 Tax=Flavobacterium sp. TaxID=239 RepID=UPI00260AD458|nr:DUF2167 domain-containing protein [Flavobacterium sp.]MDD5149167.1 DUF2167 domain-containing protein [Flavobacterium sp.]
MKKTTLTLIASLLTIFSFSQEENQQIKIDSIENSFHYEHGTISLKNGVGKIIIPNGFKYLNPEQSERVLVDLWGNPKSDNLTLGLILPENLGVMSENGYVFNIQYDEIGFVKDDDADDIDYDELMTQMKEETVEENKERKKEGYDPISIVGWAAKPFYDEDRKILHWAKEIKFGNSDVNTLNYNVRVLGRKGVLVLNAIATKAELPLVQKDINKVLDIVQFNDGYKYKDFDSSVDEVAAWTIGGLVAGKVLAKVGIFAIIAKFGKVIALAFFGFFGAFRTKIKNFFSKNKKAENDSEALAEHSEEIPEETIEETTEETIEKENEEPL